MPSSIHKCPQPTWSPSPCLAQVPGLFSSFPKTQVSVLFLYRTLCPICHLKGATTHWEHLCVCPHYKKIIYCVQMSFSPGMQGWFNTQKSVKVIYHINGIKDKCYVLISRDAENTFDRTQYPFMIQTHGKVGIKRDSLNLNKECL